MILRLAKNLKSNTMKKIDDYTIGELKEIIRQKEQKKDWREQAKGGYYINQDNIGCYNAYNIRTQLPFHYKKESDAELFAKKVDLFNRMNLFAIIHNDGWVADWCNNDQKKWGLSSSGYRFTSDYDYVYNSFLFGISVRSEEIAEAMFEEFKDELEVYLQ